MLHLFDRKNAFYSSYRMMIDNNEYNFYGSTSKEDIAGAEKLKQEEFEEMLEKYIRDKERVRL